MGPEVFGCKAMAAQDKLTIVNIPATMAHANVQSVRAASDDAL